MIYKEYNKDTYNIYTIKTDKFKTCHMEIVFRNNIVKEEVTKRSLITEMIVENSNNYKTRRELVIKCEELNCFVMAVFLQDEEDRFILYKSTNLLDWIELQRVPIKGDYECPDIYKIKVEETGEYVYVLQGACGNYIVGNINNGKFEFDLNVKSCLYGEYIDYCAQSFSNLDNRIVQVNWQKSTVYSDMPWG